MNKKFVEQLLIEIDDFSRAKKLSKRGMSQKLNIPYSTFNKWFRKGKVKGNPSPAYIEKIEKFLESQKETDTYWKDLWIKILEWWETQHQYSTVRELADDIGWDVQNLNYYLQNKEMPPKLVVEKIVKTIGFEVPNLDFLIQEAQRKTEKIKYLLLFLEEELRWFRDGSKEARDIFREKLDLGDIGYVSSLLTMLGDEDKFKRWLTLTTNRFNFFKKKGGRNEKSFN
jgi:transcriptional regulator with XRE-family HTH domain